MTPTRWSRKRDLWTIYVDRSLAVDTALDSGLWYRGDSWVDRPCSFAWPAFELEVGDLLVIEESI